MPKNFCAKCGKKGVYPRVFDEEAFAETTRLLIVRLEELDNA